MVLTALASAGQKYPGNTLVSKQYIYIYIYIYIYRERERERERDLNSFSTGHVKIELKKRGLPSLTVNSTPSDLDTTVPSSRRASYFTTGRKTVSYTNKNATPL
jgi:hypothetical protein